MCIEVIVCNVSVVFLRHSVYCIPSLADHCEHLSRKFFKSVYNPHPAFTPYYLLLGINLIKICKKIVFPAVS